MTLIVTPLHRAQIDRINAILDSAGPTPGYNPGETLLTGEQTVTIGMTSYTVCYRIHNQSAGDTTNLHYIHFSVYSEGNGCHESRQRITSLSDHFRFATRDARFDVEFVFTMVIE